MYLERLIDRIQKLLKSIEELGEAARDSIRENHTKQEDEEEKARIIEEIKKQANANTEKAQV